MHTLTRFTNGPDATREVIGKIYALRDQCTPGLIVFEIADGDGCERLASNPFDVQLYAINDKPPFWAKLERLAPTHPVHPEAVALGCSIKKGILLWLSEAAPGPEDLQ
jgi:hypothetical protein